MSEQVTIHANGIEITRTFRAPLATAWDTWTNADDFAVWFNAKRDSVELDVRPGGSWHATMETPGGDFPLSGVYREVVEHEKLVWTVDFGPEPIAMSATFSEADGVTTIVYTQDVVGDADCDDAESGANGILDAYERQLERRVAA
jgi:uncharacterized protein YndB with AHSA1/START domain